MRNDIVFKKSDNSLIVLIEHQSSRSGSMDIRLLLYYSRVLESYIKETNKYGLFDSNIKIPETEFYVLHNGRSTVKKAKNYKIELLIDKIEKLAINVRVKNINYNMLEEEILKKKDSLTTYAYLLSNYYRNIIELKKTYLEESEDFISAEAFNLALESCKEKDLYLEIFSKEGFRTVMNGILTFEDNLELQYDLGLEDGKKEGMKKGLIRGLLMAGLNDEEVIKKADITREDLEAYKEDMFVEE